MEEFWLKKAKDYADKKFEINELGTHPELLKMFEKYKEDNWANILDYGCGDGSLLNKYDFSSFNLSIYDKSPEMLKIAKTELSNYEKVKIHHSMDEIEKGFDCVFLSMVLICIAEKCEIQEIANKIENILNKNGILLIANPHPCFRDENFSSYYTEFSIGKKFNYFDNGEPHQIFLRNTGINFTDYNWQISQILNTFTNSNLKLIELEEIKDNKGEFENFHASPSIIYVFKK